VRPAAGRRTEDVPRGAGGHSGGPRGAGPDVTWVSGMRREARGVAPGRPGPRGRCGSIASGAFPATAPAAMRPVAGAPAGSSGRGRASPHTARRGWHHRPRSRGSSDKLEPSEFSRAWPRRRSTGRRTPGWWAYSYKRANGTPKAFNIWVGTAPVKFRVAADRDLERKFRLASDIPPMSRQVTSPVTDCEASRGPPRTSRGLARWRDVRASVEARIDRRGGIVAFVPKGSSSGTLKVGAMENSGVAPCPDHRCHRNVQVV
jgi:hypothetical protein